MCSFLLLGPDEGTYHEKYTVTGMCSGKSPFRLPWPSTRCQHFSVPQDPHFMKNHKISQSSVKMPKFGQFSVPKLNNQPKSSSEVKFEPKLVLKAVFCQKSQFNNPPNIVPICSKSTHLAHWVE